MAEWVVEIKRSSHRGTCGLQTDPEAMSHLGQYIRNERRKQGWTPQRLAIVIGYRNCDKGARRILAFEQTGMDRVGLADRVVRVLKLDRTVLAELIRQDEEQRLEAFERWVNVPIKPYMTVRWFPGFYSDVHLPSSIRTHVDVEAYACRFAKKRECTFVSFGQGVIRAGSAELARYMRGQKRVMA